MRRYTLKSQHPHQIQRVVQQLLREETQFVQQNREHLKHVPFYREQFDLSQHLLWQENIPTKWSVWQSDPTGLPNYPCLTPKGLNPRAAGAIYRRTDGG